MKKPLPDLDSDGIPIEFKNTNIDDEDLKMYRNETDDQKTEWLAREENIQLHAKIWQLKRRRLWRHQGFQITFFLSGISC